MTSFLYFEVWQLTFEIWRIWVTFFHDKNICIGRNPIFQVKFWWNFALKKYCLLPPPTYQPLTYIERHWAENQHSLRNNNCVEKLLDGGWDWLLCSHALEFFWPRSFCNILLVLHTSIMVPIGSWELTWQWMKLITLFPCLGIFWPRILQYVVDVAPALQYQ